MIFPTSFKYEVIKNDDNNINIRCDAKSIDDINMWVAEFGKLNNYYWNFRSSVPNGKRIVCS